MARLVLQLQRNQRQALRWRGLRASSRCVSTNTSTGWHDPSPTELLRATLLGATTPNTSDGTHLKQNKRILELLDTDWPRGSPPPPLWYALKGVPPREEQEDSERLHSVASLSSVRNATERLVVNSAGAEVFQRSLKAMLQQCHGKVTYSEIQSTLSDIAVRLQRLELPMTADLCELGMYYAALNLSSPAFHQVFKDCLRLDPDGFTFVKSGAIIRALYETVRLELFKNPNYDAIHILAEVTGEYAAVSEQSIPKFHDVLHRNLDLDLGSDGRRNWATYLCLLSKLRSDKPFTHSWTHFLNKAIDSEQELHATYRIVSDLIQSGRSVIAAKCLEDISIRNRDQLPYIATFRHLQVLLDDPVVSESLPDVVGNELYGVILELAFSNMEQRLGIQWQADGSTHIGISANSSSTAFEDQPLLTIDGDCAGYDDPIRLYAELYALGCSHSPADLGRIVNLLNEHDGNALDVVPEFRSESALPEFRWCPQHSPIEFSHAVLPTVTDSTREWTPALLGLIRARPLINDMPQERAGSFHFLQLGSLEIRRGPHEAWQPSGYIVGWNRLLGRMTALFVGKDAGLIDSGPMPSAAPFGTLLHLRPSHMHALVDSPWSSVDPFYLDLDPGRDLGFQ
ncbi:hypothetical protein N7532_008985 [Penicillium argentinense]|uniref:Uncharacterized protein n=1 Tax=Penicillium argentinense TaxID=1131581 RepID=A0A9W9K2K1_9EURO|nr:uncharacterized protein N7532_008985 [Penicillium argentinense]KAJ5090301.1 hypothetical protein N7532_008985 [Penicillium argentinense]